MIVSHIQNLIQNNSSDEESFPEGWATARLEDICTSPQYGWTTSADRNRTDLKLLRTTDISSGIVDWSTVPGCAKEPNDSEKYLLEPGDIVISRAGSVGLSYLVKECPRAIFASYLIRFRPKPPIESEFIALFLKSQQYWAAIADETIGIAIPNVNASKLRKIEIPLPPLAEQKRVVAKVEELLVRVKAAHEHLAKVKELLKRFRQSVLATACSGRLTADWREKYPDVEPASELLRLIIEERKKCYKEKYTKAKAEGLKKPKKDYEFSIIKERSSIAGWAEAKLEDLIYIAGRIGWRGLKAEEYTTDGPLFLSVHGLNYGEEVDFRDAYHISMERYNESPEIQLQENDILLAKDGAGIGKIGIIKNLNQLATVNSSLLVIRSLEAFVPKYLFYFLSGPKLQNIAKARITGSATPHLFQKDIKEFALSIPPFLEQKEIVRRAKALFKLADGIEKRVAAARARAEKLSQAILSKAFGGELVPTEVELARREGRSYEPASALLAKVKAQQRDVKPQRKRGRALQRKNNISVLTS